MHKTTAYYIYIIYYTVVLCIQDVCTVYIILLCMCCTHVPLQPKLYNLKMVHVEDFYCFKYNNVVYLCGTYDMTVILSTFCRFSIMSQQYHGGIHARLHQGHPHMGPTQWLSSHIHCSHLLSGIITKLWEQCDLYQSMRCPWTGSHPK